MKHFLFLLVFFLMGCNTGPDTLFKELKSNETGINFENRILEKEDFNIFNYRNFYNGGGVAIGDLNKDGLADIFVTSNFEDNKLYLNKGGLEFEDITVLSGISNDKFWSTGVTFADVNADGLLDVYVCNSGSRDQRGNQLFINTGIENGIPKFTEMAVSAGIADGGYSTHAAFFDYDKDGDLDMYLLNNSFTPIDKLGFTNLRDQRDKLGGDKLFRNDSDKEIKFTDVSEEAGIYGSLIGFGLGITIGDVNKDNWPDIYISNDFYEKDYLYINNQNGTFKEDLESQMPHTSLSSMGADIADINNDGNLDIFVTDMLPGDDARLKTTSVFEGFNIEKLKESRGFYHQYMRNNLHLNNGDGSFSEIGQFAGVHATDWSWGALIFDMDNDGQKDLFVANGIAKDLTDQDFVEFLGSKTTMQSVIENNKFEAKEFIDKISSVPISNYAFKNNGNLSFSNEVSNLGLEGPGFSNGSAYGDLDNDGDLDLVVNNLNAPLSVFENKSNEKLKNNYLTIGLKGKKKNLNGIGATVQLFYNGKQQLLQQMPNRGFQSSSDLNLVFGLGETTKIDSLKVLWPSNTLQVIVNPEINKKIILEESNAKVKFSPPIKNTKPIFVDNQALEYKHKESKFIDYNRDVLLKQSFATQGPAIAVGDINNDGLEDIYLGGAAGQTKQLFLQKANGKFMESVQEDFSRDKTTENTDALFLDANADGFLDLFVATGSNEFLENAPELHDLLYLNDGKGNLKREAKFPTIFENRSIVISSDFDKDGDLDVFLGSRMIGGKYGLSPPSHFYINDGKGTFKNQSKRYMPEIIDLGMVTSAVFVDFNKDGYQDLIIGQDWGGIRLFINEKGEKLTFYKEIEDTEGIWNTLKVMDIDNDGDLDFIAGNIGDNTKLKVTNKQPAVMYINDFDSNGIYEQIISCFTEDGKSYPMVLKGELQRALPSIKKKYPTYKEYANKSIEQIFSEKLVKEAVKRKLTTTKTTMFINDGNGNFSKKDLPLEVSMAHVSAIEAADFDHDGNLDILMSGNFYDVLPEWGRFDSNSGIFLKGDGKGNFAYVAPSISGFKPTGQIRQMRKIKIGNKEALILVKNNDFVQLYTY